MEADLKEWLDTHRNPARLAELISLAARVDPALLRVARLHLGFDVSTEFEVWFSPLVESSNWAGLVLKPLALDLLRARLKESGQLDLAWELTRTRHLSLAPALRLQEELAHFSLALGEAAQEKASQRLQEVLVAIVRENRTQLASWAASALPRLPNLLRQLPQAQLLAQAAKIHGFGSIPGIETSGPPPSWMTSRRPSGEPVGLRLYSNYLKFRRPPSAGDTVLPLSTQFWVSWWASGERKTREVNLLGRALTIRFEGEAVQIDTDTVGPSYLVCKKQAQLRAQSYLTKHPEVPLLIQVLSGFLRTGPNLEERVETIDLTLRHDYPETVYWELRALFQKSLEETIDLAHLAKRLAEELSVNRKVILGLQLYDLIATAGMQQEHVIAYYSFMSQLGMAAQAIDIVYQLNAADTRDPSVYQKGSSPLESVVFGSGETADVQVEKLGLEERLIAYRYQELILFKNLSLRRVVVQRRALAPGEFGRIFTDQLVAFDGQVLSHQDLVFYLNAKKNGWLLQIFVVVTRNGEVRLKRVPTRNSCLEVKFGLKVQVTALKSASASLNGVTLEAGTTVSATLRDRIIFASSIELPLLYLRQQAEAMGGTVKSI